LILLGDNLECGALPPLLFFIAVAETKTAKKALDAKERPLKSSAVRVPSSEKKTAEERRIPKSCRLILSRR
jgi:hypothetical protein